MPKFTDHLEEIKTLISSNNKPNKSLAYSTFLHLQEQSSESPPSIEVLAENSSSLLALILVDIHDDDEEIAAQALKCLGFIIYHPSIVARIPVTDAVLVLESLAKLITTTKMKSICNLGVWCISMQQFDSSFLASQFNSLLRAVVHALDNPIGSLSTTFEAMQAVMKLRAQLTEKMRESSHIWVPPIYRRLLSIDKKERDMSERCLFKIRSIICPPALTLSKAIAQETKKKLLPGMKDLLNKGMKIQAIQAWGWFISLLGSLGMKNKHLTNDMLKVPEQTFSDHNPQVQIASQVAWEGLIDALIQPQTLACETDVTFENDVPRLQTSVGNGGGFQSNGFLKSMKLVMKPLIGIIFSKCDISVHLSCLNTWCYLLHKLDTSINSPSVIEMVLDPIFEAVFQTGPDSTRLLLWDFCLDLLDDFILSKHRDVNCDLSGQVNLHLSARTCMRGTFQSGRLSCKQYPIKWLPCDPSHLDFYIKMIGIIVSHVSAATATPESRSSACNAVLRIFRSILKSVEVELKSLSINYDTIMLFLNAILKLLKKICKDTCQEGSSCDDLLHTSLRLIEAVTEELNPSILGSPLYRVALDLKYISNLQSISNIGNEKVLHQSSVAYMDMVSPLVYLNILYICVVVQLTLNKPKMELTLQGLQNFFKFVMFSYDPQENLLATVGLLYKHMGLNYIEIWTAIAQGLNGYIDGTKDLYPLKTEFDNTGYISICHLLAYPFLLCSYTLKNLILSKADSFLKESVVLSEGKLALAIEVWKSLHFSVSIANCEFSAANSFTADLCMVLNKYLDENAGMFQYESELGLSYKDLELGFFSLFGELLICVFERILSSANASSGGSKPGHTGGCKAFSGLDPILGFAARFLKLPLIKIGKEQKTSPIISGAFSSLARLVSHLHLKQNILSFFEILSCPLLRWLSHVEIAEEIANQQLGILWAESLNSLRRSQPPVIFDSSLLKLQASLLEKALGHPNSSISEPTVIFWNSTYGRRIKLDYPQNLLHVLDKLSRNGRINLHKGSVPSLKRCSALEDVAPLQRYRVTSTHSRSSKRVELVDDMVNQNKVRSFLKRKRLELTEHQKEVRRAQQGKERDCSGHGPGIRTYTSIDFVTRK